MLAKGFFPMHRRAFTRVCRQGRQRVFHVVHDLAGGNPACPGAVTDTIVLLANTLSAQELAHRGSCAGRPHGHIHLELSTQTESFVTVLHR